ncbi:MAG: GDSL family lipase [Lunatimonas sp.]|uniref:GDSL-type esterase/lipase family protein n=1 Tax=Lunatimonas sp. TaxID=2060141 RepID=UPI00263B9C2C|nr:GDSL-type esterase/lipase family protein [Lunatimonas sp.]MCC5936916.1 GDSL family lipase [Lunatimonas sp.]
MLKIFLQAPQFRFFFAALLVVLSYKASAQSEISGFELQRGDRVVLLGSALAENEQFYNYLEFSLSRHWPERSITFRNLGWSGDNVHGDARSYYTSPPTPFELLISQIKEANPTHVFLAYGSVEAHEGPSGIQAFEEGLEKLMTTFQELNSQVIFLSPIPQFGGASDEFLKQRNQELTRYADQLARFAQKHESVFIDLIKPLSAIGASLSDDGVHLNESGYYHLSDVIEKALGLTHSNGNILISADGKVESPYTVQMESSNLKTGQLVFRVDEPILPKPLPTQAPDGSIQPPVITIKGLKKGFYSLTANGKIVASASANAWASGLPLAQGGTWAQSDHLRQLLNKKDEVFFFKYRPLNRTYIIGFREYEQGRHVKDLEDFNVVLTWLQGQITAAKQPSQVLYELKPVK